MSRWQWAWLLACLTALVVCAVVLTARTTTHTDPPTQEERFRQCLHESVDIVEAAKQCR